MQKLWSIILVVVFAAALALILAGIFGTEHQLYSRSGKVSPAYEGSDPLRIREYSFG